MPTYTFFIYSNTAMVYNSSTNEFDLSPTYDPAIDRFRVDVTDDDPLMNAGGDSNQNATVYDMNGNFVNSGNIFVPQYAELDDGAGGMFFLDRVEVDGVRYGYVSSEPLTAGGSYPILKVGVSEVNHTYYQANSTPCFGPDTLIETTTGPCVISSLKLGDLVHTYDNGPQPIVWSGKMPVSALQALSNPKTRPVRFSGGIYGIDSPTHPLILSQQHRVMIEGPDVALLTGNDQVFAPARALETPHMPKRGVIWHHILLPQHEVICANGIWVESLSAGGALDELLTPDQFADAQRALHDTPHLQTARLCLRRHEVEVLFHRLRSKHPAKTRNIRVA